MTLPLVCVILTYVTLSGISCLIYSIPQLKGPLSVDWPLLQSYTIFKLISKLSLMIRNKQSYYFAFIFFEISIADGVIV